MKETAMYGKSEKETKIGVIESASKVNGIPSVTNDNVKELLQIAYTRIAALEQTVQELTESIVKSKDYEITSRETISSIIKTIRLHQKALEYQREINAKNRKNIYK